MEIQHIRINVRTARIWAERCYCWDTYFILDKIFNLQQPAFVITNTELI